MEEERIEESSVRLVSSSGGGDGSARWVDGSEVDSQSPPSSLLDENESIRDGYGSVRRRLAKKPKRLDSLYVEAMQIAESHGHDSKVKIEPLNQNPNYGCV